MIVVANGLDYNGDGQSGSGVSGGHCVEVQENIFESVIVEEGGDDDGKDPGDNSSVVVRRHMMMMMLTMITD